MLETAPSLLLWQRNILRQNKKKENFNYTPWEDVFFSSSAETVRLTGETFLKEGKVACLILAGGQGSRVGKAVPKGTLGVSLVKEKSLFQILFEKIFYAELLYRKKFCVAVMTSTINHQETVSFLKKNSWFGLDEDQVFFFTQEDLPFVSIEPEGEEDWLLSNAGDLLKGPSGNGDALRLFYQSKLFALFKDKGIEHLTVIPIDNPLAEPFDPLFLGFHVEKKVDVSLKSVERKSQQEKVGLLVSDQGSLRVVEYGEHNVNLSFPFANIGFYCFKMEFISFLQGVKEKQPWHVVRKKMGSVSFWKFERFLFDVFLFTNKIGVFIEPRETCFSPLKNEIGEDSFFSVKKDLLALDRKVYKELTGKDAPVDVFELSLAFYYSKAAQQSLMEKKDWKEGEYVDYSGF